MILYPNSISSRLCLHSQLESLKNPFASHEITIQRMKCTFSLEARLKSSKLPEQAAAAEQRHREEVEAETQKALAQKERRNQVGRGDGRMGLGVGMCLGKNMEKDGDDSI